MIKHVLFYMAIAISTVGCTLIGLGFGKLFNEIWAGILIGLGIGMIITAIIVLKNARKSDTSKTEYIETK